MSIKVGRDEDWRKVGKIIFSKLFPSFSCVWGKWGDRRNSYIQPPNCLNTWGTATKVIPGFSL